jgi:hypothetical protein
MPCSDVNNNSYGGNVMSDRYIPKVGDEGFEWSNQIKSVWMKCGKVIAETNKQIAYLDAHGEIGTLSKTHEFRPIPTKADVERERLGKLIDEYRTYMGGDDDALINQMQKDGFTIPKKVKRSEILEVAKVDLFSEEAESFTDVICQLLGDLVESDL